MSEAELKAQILETEKYAALSHWRRTIEWERLGGFRTYSEDELSPAGKRALQCFRSGDERGEQLAMTELTHWDSVIFSTLALSSPDR